MRKRTKKHRCASSRSSAPPPSSTLIFVMMAAAASAPRLVCDALLTRARVRVGGNLRSNFSSNPISGRMDKRCGVLSPSLDAVAADEIQHNSVQIQNESNAPKLILPSHPDFPITSVMAPMVAASDYPFRVFLREHCGVDLTFTQMLLAKKFVADKVFRKAHLDLLETTDSPVVNVDDLLPSQLNCIGDLDEYRERQKFLRETSKPFQRHGTAPLMVQLAGDNVDEMVRTAMMIYDHTEGNLHGIDLNCGCPQQIASKGNYGAFLMERDSESVYKILGALRKNLPPEVCLSAKIRLPQEDNVLVKERIPMLLETGINFLTIHGRTLKENKTKVKNAHIDRIQLAIETAHKIDPSFPVVANGGMENYEDVQRILEMTGASAAMSSEALLETPDLFLKGSTIVDCPDGDRNPEEERFRKQLSFAKDYLDICTRVGPPLPGVLGYHKSGSFNVVRSHLFKFLHRYINTDHTDLRERLAALGANGMRTLGDARKLVDELESRYQNLSREQWRELESSPSSSSWYRRHRKPDRRVHVRGDPKEKKSSISDAGLSIEDRKREIKERLAKMHAQKQKRSEKKAKRFV